MQELKFAEEPFDFKLFILCFMKRIGIVLGAALIGLIVVCGGHYLKKAVFDGPQKYEAATTYYIQYYADPQTGVINQYTNEATWKSTVGMDWFVDRVWEHALKQGLSPEAYGITKDDLLQYISARLDSDMRIPTTVVVTQNKELTGILSEAVQAAMGDLVEDRTEMLGLEILDETGVQEKKPDIRILRACILGAIVGAFAACVILSFWLIADDSVIVPETFTYRYGLPMLGVVCKGEKELSEETGANIAYKFGEQEKDALYALECGNVLHAVVPSGFQLMKKEALPEGYGKLRESAGVLLLVEAGMRNSKEIEHVLHELRVQDCPVKGALLCGGDSGLLKAYYGQKALK